MTNKIPHLLLALTIIISLSACSLFSNKDEPNKVVDIVQSADKIVSLEIPRGALPKGTDLSSIKITKTAESSLNVKAGETVVSYKMEPDGLEFSEDVIFQTEFTGTKDGLPLFYHISNGIVEPAKTEYIIKGDNVTVRIPVSHFSTMSSIQGSRNIKVKANSSDTIVGNNINASAKVEINDEDMIEGTAKIKGYITIDYGPISPNRVDDRPPQSIFAKSYTVISNDFKCDEVGDGGLDFHMFVTWDVNDVMKDGKNIPFTMETTIMIVDDFECKNEPPKFELHMGDLPASNFDYNYEDVIGKSEKELKKLGDTLRIHAYNHLIGGRDEYFPFPDTQFNIDERVYLEHESSIEGGYCANIHFNTAKALDIFTKWRDEPKSICGWGTPFYTTGALIITPKQLSEWLEAYGGVAMK